MVIGNGFFTWTENEARQEMEKLAGCKVLPCVFETIGNLQYFISERGDVFSMQKIQGHYLTRGPKRPASLTGHNKRKNGGLTHRLCYAPKREKFVPCEQLVYCTFILGYWDPDIRLEFVNGRATDIRPDNIRPCKDAPHPEWNERMEAYKDIYEKEFEHVVEIVNIYEKLDIEDVKDIVQSTFVWLTTIGFRDQFSVALWIWWGRRRAIDFMAHFIDHFEYRDFDEEKYLGVGKLTYEVDLISKLRGEKTQRYLKLWCQGHTPTQIAEMCGTTINNVGASVTHSIRFLQRYLKHEIEQYG